MRAIIAETRNEWMPFMNEANMRSLIAILNKIMDEYDKSNRWVLMIYFEIINNFIYNV